MTAEDSPERNSKTRHSIAGAKRIEDSIRAAQACGLVPSGITHGADGSTTIHFGAVPAQVRRKPKGWDI